MTLNKINFQNGTIVRSNFLNEIQKGTTFDGANRAEYYAPASESEQTSWAIGQRDGIKDWELDPRFGLGSVASSGRINKWQAKETTPITYEGVAGTPDIIFFNPDTGAPSVDPYISINEGSFIDHNGQKQSWSTTSLAIKDNSTNYIYYRFDSSTSTWTFTFSQTKFPSSETIHVPIAKITLENGSIAQNDDGSIFHENGFVDYRQGSYSGYLNSYSSQLINTDIKISDYQAKNLDRVLCNTASGSFVVTLPENPEDGTRIGIVDIYGSFDQFPLIIRAFEQEVEGVLLPRYTINGSSDNWILNTKNTYISLFYSELVQDWRFEDLPLDESSTKLGRFLSCGGREIIPNIVSSDNCPTGQNIPSEYPNPSLGTYYWDSTQNICYAEVNSTTALYSNGTAVGSIKEYNSKRCLTPEDVNQLSNENKRNVIYVDPVIGNDSANNAGDILTPFRTVERAILEGARRSYKRGSENDIIDSISIQLAPGEYYVDNSPGVNDINLIDTLSLQHEGLINQIGIINTEIIESYNPDYGFFVANLPANNSRDLVAYGLQLGRVIYSSSGGVGTISRLRQLTSNSGSWRVYVTGVSGLFDVEDSLYYDALYKFNPSSGGLILPRGISINGNDLRKVKIKPMYVPAVSSGKKTAVFRVTGNTYVSQLTFADNKQFNFSHSNVTAIEYASKCELIGIGAQRPDGSVGQCSGELAYYQKITKLFNVIDGYTTSTEGRIDEWSIVTTSAVERSRRFDDLIVNLTGQDKLYNDQDNILSDINDSSQLLVEVPGPAVDTNTAFFGLGLPDVNSTRSSSPYVFNCSVRSIYGMNGMHADGSKIEGLRSMVVAQFTQVSLQVDPSAFLGPYLPETPSADREKRFKDAYRHFGFKASNDAYIQIVSCFVIGNADHFLSESGGDLSITNSCSDFGDVSLKAIGYKTVAFSQDVKKKIDYNDLTATHISEIIPPRPLSGTYLSLPDETQAGNVSTGLTIDRALTLSNGESGKIYLSSSFNSKSQPPSASNLSGGNKYSYTKQNGTLLSGPTEYQKVFIKGKSLPDNNNSRVNSVSNSADKSFSTTFSTNALGFIRKVVTPASGAANSATTFAITSLAGIVPTLTSVYYLNSGTPANIVVTSTDITDSVQRVTLQSALPSTPSVSSNVFFYRNDRQGSEVPVRSTNGAISTSGGNTVIPFADITGMSIGDLVYGPSFSQPLPIVKINQLSGNQGTIEVTGTGFSIPNGSSVFVGVRQERSTIPLKVRVLNQSLLDTNITTTGAGEFEISVDVAKLGDRSNFIIEKIEVNNSGPGFKSSSFQIVLNTTGDPKDNYLVVPLSTSDGVDVTNYVFNPSYTGTSFVGSPGYIEDAILNVNVKIDTGTDFIYFANLLPPVDENGINYFEIPGGEFDSGIGATRPDIRSRIFGWDQVNLRWFIRVAPAGVNNTIWTAINSSPNPNTNPIISNSSSVGIRRKIDRRAADQRIYRIKVSGFKDSVRKPLSGYILQSQDTDWEAGNTSRAFIIADVKDTPEEGISLATGEFILTILKVSDAGLVISKDYYPDVDYDNPESDPSSATKTALLEFTNPSLSYNIKDTNGNPITLSPSLSSFTVKRLYPPSTLSLAYCELRRPSLIRATNHTWEWVGYLNYDTALPSLQGNALTPTEKQNKILTEQNGGRVYATGMDEDGIFRIGSFAYDLKVNKQFDTSIPTNITEIGAGGGGSLAVQLNGATLSPSVNTLNFLGDGLVLINGSTAEISLGSVGSEISGTKIINGTIGPSKLDRKYVQLSGDTLTGKLFGTDFEASGTIQGGLLRFGQGFSNVVGTNATGNKTISTSAPSGAGSQGDIWYVI